MIWKYRFVKVTHLEDNCGRYTVERTFFGIFRQYTGSCRFSDWGEIASSHQWVKLSTLKQDFNYWKNPESIYQITDAETELEKVLKNV